MSHEADIHAELYRHVQNAIDDGFRPHGVNYTNATNEVNVSNGYADLVVEVDNEPFLVVEAKRDPVSNPSRDINPYSPEVVEQASSYAFKLGAPYFATYNGKRCVVYNTWERKRLMERKSRAYKVDSVPEFAQDLLSEVAGLESNNVDWDPSDEAFITRLDTFHTRLQSEFLDSLHQRLTNDEDFEKKYLRWVADQGWSERFDESEARVHNDFTAQSAYLLMNKLVFYKTLENADAYEPPEIELESLVDPGTRRAVFDELMDKIDFEAIYEQDEIFDSLPLTNTAQLEVQELLTELDDYDLDQLGGGDVIGDIYEGIIPEEERHELGQYYTPEPVTELITNLVVRSPDDTVLDPSVGSGGFLLAAYDQLKRLKEAMSLPATHQGLLNQMYGVDINRFPAHLSALNLALKDLSSETTDTGVIVEDFFNIRPGDERLAEAESAGTEGSGETFDIPRKVNAIIGNPPYIENDEIAEDVNCRGHMDRVGADLNRDSDIYSYFFTHSTEFLEEGGRLGFITSNKWLAIRYGVGLKQFLRENYRIKAVVKPQKRVFKGQLVPTCITILEKDKNPTRRDETVTKFMLVRERLNPEKIINILETDHDADILYEEDGFRLATKKQRDLDPEQKWTRYLFAPSEFWTLYNHSKMAKLKTISEDIGRGIGDTTGADHYFYLDEEEMEEWNIEDRFSPKAAKSITQFDGLEFNSQDSEIHYLDLYNFAEDYLHSDKSPPSEYREEVQRAEQEYINTLDDDEETPPHLSETEITVMAGLKDEGYPRTYEYLIWGVKEGVHTGKQCARRKYWFAVDDIPTTQLVAPKNIRGRPFFPTLTEPMPLGNTLYRVNLKNDEYRPVIAGFLNSNVGKMFFELQGTSVRGGLVELRSYELKDFSVIDPDELTNDEQQRIEEAFEEVKNVDVHEDEAPEKMLELDRAVLAPFGLEEKAEKIMEIATSLSQSRQLEQEFEVPVASDGEGGQGQIQDLSGSERIDGQVGLDQY
ncbi:HsdM family class I SAM-dependent methyltransferase [Halorubrum distributum]|uniref:N-6 DNA methylase n=1 Tax=Halorubrum distributum TaxID=29283 RepID=A0A6B1IRP8_9EURY|nr:N-6 DNA methylase [Halorubrum terrestre]MYL69134.1 N-6 DNA methylase [Halorubrum terrestre]